MVHLELDWVLQDLLEMSALFHVVFASIAVIANMRNLFVLASLIVLFPLLEVVHVFKLVVFYHVISVFLSELENDVILLGKIVVVWIDQHKLVVIRNVVVLIHYFILGHYFKSNLIFLNQKLRVLMD